MSAEPGTATALRVMVTWSGEQPLLPGRAYTVRRGERSQSATIAPLHYRLEPDTGEHVAARILTRGQIGACDIELTEPIGLATEPGETAVRFEIHDTLQGGLLGIAVVEHSLRRSDNVRWQTLKIDKAERAAKLGQVPTVLWLTGISAAGKSTIANLVESELHRRGHHTYLLDGDNVRHGLNSDLGFKAADRVENIRRVAEVARLMTDAGLIVIVSFISPFRAERAMARGLLEAGEFLEVWVDVPLEVAEARDPKGLYRKARSGELVNFTGIDSPYEPPENPDLHLETAVLSPEQAAAQVVEELARAGRLGSGVSPGSGPHR